jgi:two-component system, OmpR family, response regulator VanR
MPNKVLLINNTGAASLLPGLLTRNGYSVDTAFNTAEGLPRLDIQSYNLVILLESPAAESWLLCEKIRGLTGMPLIVISSNASTETCVKAISAGADYFIRKPFGPLELLARVGSLFQRTVYRQPVSLVS